MKYLLLAFMFTVVVSAQAADDGQAAETPAGQAGGRGGAFRQKLLEKFDTNHDGKLEPDELAAAKAAMKQHREEIKKKLLAKFDTNHNGKLDPDELAAAKAWIQAHKGQHHGKFGGGGAGRGATAAGAQKTNSTDSSAPSNSSDAEKDAVQKAMDQFNPQPSVRL